MSAIAATLTNTDLLIYSDGRALKHNGTITHNFRKVGLVNNHMAFLWVGTYPSEFAIPRMENRLREATDVVQKAANVLRELYLPMAWMHNRNRNKERMFFILLDVKGKWYGFDSDESNPFEPMIGTMNTGGSIFFSHGSKKTDGKRYQQNTQRNINKGMPPPEACKKAFGDLIKELAAEDRKVGGRIFSESLERQQLEYAKNLPVSG